MKKIQLTNEFFEGAVSVEEIDGCLKPWRVDHTKRDLFPSVNDGLLGCMESTSGVRLRFKTDSSVIILEAKPEDAKRNFDLTIDNELIQSIDLEAKEKDLVFEKIPDGDRVIEIWLPRNRPCEVAGLFVEEGKTASVIPDERIKWVTYGSSITACGEAHSPSRIWPAVTSRIHDLNLTSLGYGGNCHLEPMVGRMIRDLDADIITLKLGINIQGAGSLSPRTFKAATIGFVQIIRERHPDTPIGIISPIISPPRETNDNAVGLSLSKMRIELEDAVDRIKRTMNDEKIFYFDGLKIFGEDLVGPRLPDDLHPDGDGYEILGRNVAEQVLPVLLKNR